MELSSDLCLPALEEVLPDREIRCYPALLSTQSVALGWARAKAPGGALVIADYQASPRGRAGLEWKVEYGTSVGFSLIVHPRLQPQREGWMYTVGTLGLSDALGPTASIEWPDEVHTEADSYCAVGVDVELGPQSTEWAIFNCVVPEASQPRTSLVAAIVYAIEARVTAAADAVLADYLPRCRTLGRRVRALMIPMGPGGPQVTGRAIGSLMDGALLLDTGERRVPIYPQHLGILEDLTRDESSSPESHNLGADPVGG